MIRTSEHDYNIWSGNDNELCLTAYELKFYDNGVETNTKNYQTIKFTYPQDLVEIEYLLQDVAINHYPFTDYDTWEKNPLEFQGATPEAIESFINSLPDYKIRKETANA